MENNRFSTTSEIRRVLSKVQPGVPGGPVLDYRNRQSWVYTGEGNSLFLGVPGSGKTTRGTIPLTKSLIIAGESFVSLDSKGDIYASTATEARKHGYDVKVINYRDPYNSLRWEPLADPYKDYTSGDKVKKDRAQRTIRDMANSIFPPVLRDDPFWQDSARTMFTAAAYALMEYAKPEEVNIASVFSLIADGIERCAPNSFSSCKTYLEQFVGNMPDDSISKKLFQSYLTAPDATFSSMNSVFHKGGQQFQCSDALLEMLGGDDLNINELDGETPTAIYIIVPDETSDYFSLAGILCGQIINHFIGIAHSRYNGRLPRRLNICLEELGNIGKSIPELGTYMSAGRSRNIRCHLVLQNLSQLDKIYGQSLASTIKDNIDVIVAFRMSNWQTLTELSQKCGDHQVEYSNRYFTRPLLPATTLGAMETGRALVLISGRTKFVTLLPHFTDMFDCSECTPPEAIIRTESEPAHVFSIKEYVDSVIKKKSEEESRSPFLRPGLGFSPLLNVSLDDDDDDDELPFDSILLPSRNFEDTRNVGNLNRTEPLSLTIIYIKGSIIQVVRILHQYQDKLLSELYTELKSLPYTVTFDSPEECDSAEKELIDAGCVVIRTHNC